MSIDNIFKHVVLKLIMWPVMELDVAKDYLRVASQRVMSGGNVRWCDHKLEPILMHGKSFNKKTWWVVVLLGLASVCDTLAQVSDYILLVVVVAKTPLI